MTHYFVVSVIKITEPENPDDHITRSTEYRDVCEDSATALCELLDKYTCDLPEDQYIIIQRIRSY